MKRVCGSTIISGLLMLAVPCHAQITVDTPVFRLRQHLDVLCIEGKTGREILGYSMLGTGGLLIGIPISLTQGDLNVTIAPENRPLVLGSMFLGAVLAGFSFVSLSSETLPEKYNTEYWRLAEGTEEEKNAKIRRGEMMLEELAQVGRQGRLITGLAGLTGFIASSTALIVCLANGSINASTPGTYGLSSLGVVCSVVLICVIFPSQAEIELRSYKEWKESGSSSSGPEVTVTPSLSGLGIRVSF